MNKILIYTAVFSWLVSLLTWELLFYNHAIVADILWEIHTIFSSVIVFYSILNTFLKEETLDYIKIIFRIVFKVWIIIFIAFSMQHSFSQKGFVLTATFIFGYLEGLIDTNAWLRSNSFLIKQTLTSNLKTDKLLKSVVLVSFIHVFCAFITFLFFKF